VLRARGAVVEECVAYLTLEAPDSSLPALRAALSDAPVAVLALSGSAVRGLLALAERLGPETVSAIRRLPVISIGPETTATAQAHGLDVLASAGMQTSSALAALAAEVLRPVPAAEAASHPRAPAAPEPR
jgi:uroporphyrinogen-III synthase